MLDEMDLRAMGARGIAHLALVELETSGPSDLVEILTPIAKYHCTEIGSQAADIGIQVLGGYGYLEEYGLAQILRDVRISRIYEGANGIHALTLATRHLANLQVLDDLTDGEAGLSGMLADWRSAREDMQRLPDPRQLADAFMRLTAELVHQLVWGRIKGNADHHPDKDRVLRLARRASARWIPEFAHFSASREAL